MSAEETAGQSHDSDTDRAIVDALRGDNDPAARHALESLFKRTAAPLARFARRVGAMDNADDVVTDVFAGLWDRRQALDPAFRPEPYLYRAVRNRTLQYLRGDARAWRRMTIAAQQARLEREADEIDTDALTETDSVTDLVWRAVDQLAESQRTALILRLSHGLPLADVAEAMELSIPAVKMLLQRAFKTLRTRLTPLLDSVEP